MHTIRLKYPWTRFVIDNDVDANVGDHTNRVDVPDLSTSETAIPSSVRYQRKFNQPTGLDEHSRVWLFVESCVGNICRVAVNAQAVKPSQCPMRVNITSFLDRHNQIEIDIEATDSVWPRISGHVMLEIEDSFHSTV